MKKIALLRLSLVSILGCLVLYPGWLKAADQYSGTYTNGLVSLELTNKGENSWNGTIRVGNDAYPLNAKLDGEKLRGSFKNADGDFSFTAALRGNELSLTSDGTTYVLQKQSRPKNPLTAANPKESVSATTSNRSVIINGQPLTAQQLDKIEQRYPAKIPDGKYWYDKLSGAWGMQGGPTAGFVPAGQDIGGPLQANASNGHTGVFSNGRELHPKDVQALEEFMEVQSGRYWFDAQGNFGSEGGPAMGNLFELHKAAAASRGTSAGKELGRYGSVLSDGQGFIGFIDHEGRSATFQR